MFKIFQVNDTSNPVFCLVPNDNQLASPQFFSQICHILLNNHPKSVKLLHAAVPGTVLSQSGATHFIYIGFFIPPQKMGAWLDEVQRYLPPTYQLFGGNIHFNFTLTAPNEGTFPGSLIGIGPIKSDR